jgi:hypothetical protein
VSINAVFTESPPPARPAASPGPGVAAPGDRHPFGVGLAYLRDRTRSVLPGMVVHGLFNGAALAYIVVR